MFAPPVLEIADIRWSRTTQVNPMATVPLPSEHVVRPMVETVGPYEIHYRVCDTLSPPGRTPVVLVHGFVVSGTYLEPTLERLAEQAPAYAPDLPGHGKSSKETLGIDELADVLMHWARRIGLEKIDLIGNSMGCSIATSAAVRHPGHVRRLVLQGPTMEPEGRTRLASVVRGLRHMQKVLGSGFESIAFEDYVSGGTKHALETWRTALEHPLEQDLPHVQAPTLVLHAEADPIVSDEWAQEVARLLPDGHLVRVPDADHIMVYNDPDRLADAVLPFLGA